MAGTATPARVTERLLLDEHYSDAIAAELRANGYDAVAVVADPDLRAQPDAEVFRRAATSGRRIVTENVKDFRPLLQQAYAAGDPVAKLLLVPPNRFPRGTGRGLADLGHDSAPAQAARRAARNARPPCTNWC